MNWVEIFFSVVGVILTGIAGWVVTKITAWLNAKIKNEKIAKFVTDILSVTTSAVKSTYQTYVENVKGTELWDTDAQKRALEMSVGTIKSELTDGAKAYIAENFGDIDKYLTEAVESTIYDLKNTGVCENK